MKTDITTSNNLSLGWALTALAAHTGWGAQPVLTRYLQNVSELPSMSLLAVSNLLAICVIARLFWPQLQLSHFRSRTLWLFAIIVAFRGTTNLISTRFTLAIYVQVITLMTPFLVALLSLIILRETLPPYTGRAMTLASLGALLIIGGNLNLTNLAQTLTLSDSIGLGLAAFSSFCLAMYMILVRRTGQNKTPAGAVLIVQLVTLITLSLFISLLIGEDWGRWTEIGLMDWLVFFGLTGGVYLGANLSQVTAIQHLGASLVGSILPWRLIIALALAALLVGEYLTTIWQIIGALVVLVTISWYLWQQR